MYLSRKLEYNKKGNIQFSYIECLPNKLPYGTYSSTLILANERHFFITTIKMIRRNKMIVMNFKTFKTKVLFFTLSNLVPYECNN